MANLWAAFDLTGLSTNVETALIAGIGIMMLFVGYKLIKRSGRAI